jgi:hypothetical protein
VDGRLQAVALEQLQGGRHQPLAHLRTVEDVLEVGDID